MRCSDRPGHEARNCGFTFLVRERVLLSLSLSLSLSYLPCLERPPRVFFSVSLNMLDGCTISSRRSASERSQVASCGSGRKLEGKSYDQSEIGEPRSKKQESSILRKGSRTRFLFLSHVPSSLNEGGGSLMGYVLSEGRSSKKEAFGGASSRQPSSIGKNARRILTRYNAVAKLVSRLRPINEIPSFFSPPCDALSGPLLLLSSQSPSGSLNISICRVDSRATLFKGYLRVA